MQLPLAPGFAVFGFFVEAAGEKFRALHMTAQSSGEMTHWREKTAFMS
jgi:hypothetical protein